METQAANLGTQNPSRIKRDNQVEPDQLHRQYSVLSVGKGRHSAEGEEPAPKRIRENFDRPHSVKDEGEERSEPIQTNQKFQNSLKRYRSFEHGETYSQDDKCTKNSSLPPSASPADKSFDGAPHVSLEFESKIASTPCYNFGPQGEDLGNRIRDLIDEKPIQSPSCSQEVSSLNVRKDNDKGYQQEYRCPQCSFCCWLCHSAEASGEPKGHGSDEDESGQSEVMTAITPSRSSSKRKRSDGLKYLAPKDDHFEQYILLASGIRIRGGIRYLPPEGLPNDGVQDDPSMASQVRLKIDHPAASRISTQFIYYHGRQYDETTLTKLVTKWLAPFDDYIDRDGPEAVVSLWRDKWKPGKEGPPVPPINGYTYDWDIEPDMTYMVSLNIFKDDLCVALSLPALDWLLAEPVGVCPYLTFELKCAEKSGKDSHAKCQISAASVLWLYQRKKLKDELNSSDFSDLRHYSIILNSIDYQIWVAGFDGKVYSIQMIDGGSFHQPEGVEKYAKWSNAIHKWGLGPNARSFKRDVEALWKKRNNQANLVTPVSPPL